MASRGPILPRNERDVVGAAERTGASSLNAVSMKELTGIGVPFGPAAALPRAPSPERMPLRSALIRSRPRAVPGVTFGKFVRPWPASDGHG